MNFQPNPRAALDLLFSAGLTDEILSQAVKLGAAAKGNTTAHDPPTAGGFVQWQHTVRGLRDQLVPIRWTADDEKNFCTIVTPDGRQQIAVMSGNAATGN